MANRQIPEATVARLPVYLRALLDIAETRKGDTVSSEELANLAGVNAAKVRKDLSYLGSYGTRGVGYDAEYLLYQITRVLGLTRDLPIVIIGIGNLGRALASYKGFSERGFKISALLDVDESIVGTAFEGMQIRHLDDLKEVVVEEGIRVGVITTPPMAAQEVADHLVDAGVKAILNFAPTVVNVPPDVNLRKVDMSIELQVLAFYQQRNSAIESAREADVRLGSDPQGGG
jgi:redox-sensing transcriptional repressor